jgi:hypothetical protein
MIQTKEPILRNRNGVLSVLKLEVRPDIKTTTGRKFLVIDWNTSDESSAYFSKYIHKTDEEIDTLEVYIETNYDLSGLDREKREYKKLQIALILDTQTNLLEDGKTVYGLNPNDWEFTPVLEPVVEEEPIIEN